MIFGNDVFGHPLILDPGSTVVLRSADVIGEVIIGPNVFVASFAALRADEGRPFVICKGTNIQDGVTLHGFLDSFVDLTKEEQRCIGKPIEKCSIYIGSHSTLAHGCRIHGPVKIGKKTFVGFGAQVICSTIGQKSLIYHSAKVINSTIGSECVIDHDAYVDGVSLKSGVYVPPRTDIVTQEDADNLDCVPQSVIKRLSNAHIVDVNKDIIRAGYLKYPEARY